MLRLPTTMLPAAVLSAAAVLLTGCAVSANAQGSAHVSAEGAAPVSAERVGSSLSAPALRTPGDFPAPEVTVPAASAEPSPGAPDGDAAPAPTPSGAADAPIKVTAGQTFAQLPNVGPETSAQLPDSARQVLVAPGENATTTTTQLVLYQRADADSEWKAITVFAAHNGRSGWSDKRTEGDGTSPIGVFSLTDAGGANPDPESALPYTHDTSLRDGAAAVYGEDWREVFDYVIAINYNRKSGAPPTDNTRPMGWKAGGKIWLHVDHNSPTSGCVTVPADQMKYLLRTLDPKLKPHIIMGPADVLAR